MQRLSRRSLSDEREVSGMRRLDRPLTHDWIWRAIDTLAQRRDLSPSALARLAGLDPTTFNCSKRFTPEGRPRWPSTESIAKVLEATNTTLDAFAAIELDQAQDYRLDETSDRQLNALPIVGLVRNGAIAGWEPDANLGEQADEPTAPRIGRRLFALEVADNSLEPVYSSGNTLVVSEAAAPKAGDRVLVKPAGMPVLPRLLVAATSSRVELSPFSGVPERLALRRRDIDWMARIVLVRQ